MRHRESRVQQKKKTFNLKNETILKAYNFMSKGGSKIPKHRADRAVQHLLIDIFSPNMFSVSFFSLAVCHPRTGVLS